MHSILFWWIKFKPATTGEIILDQGLVQARREGLFGKNHVG